MTKKTLKLGLALNITTNFRLLLELKHPLSHVIKLAMAQRLLTDKPIIEQS